MTHLLLKSGFYSILIASFLTYSCIQRAHTFRGTATSNSPILNDLPPQPGEDSWHFIGDLKAPMWTKYAWETTSPGTQHADLSEI